MSVRQHTERMITRTLAGVVCAAALSLSGGAAHAGFTTINIGGGWEASWDDALNPFLSINSLGVIGNAVFIQKSAEFINLNPINVTFTQVNPTATTVPNIVIDDEIITNSSGVTWTDFHMDVQPAVGTTAAYNVAASAGFSVAPFLSSSFTNTNHTFNAFNGAIPNGGIWFPGLVSGQLWINITLGATPASFVLSEAPTIPAPGALALLGLAGFVGTRRRRG